MKYFIFLFFLFGLVSCSEKEISVIDVSDIDIKLEIKRFEQKFYTISPENLNDLKSEFPYLFPRSNPDSVWVNKMQNEDEQKLFVESQKLYSDFSDESNQLESLFKYIKYYYPKFKEPKVITILTNVDYENPVIWADSLLFISLDIFLGKKNDVYQDFPNYVKQNYTKEHLIVAVAEKFAQGLIPPTDNKSFVSKIIQEGKKLAMIQLFLPEVEQEEIMGYTQEQLIWAEQSEVEIWKYFIENQILYSSDSQLNDRFIKEAPFSKFFLEIDKDSPGRIGVWFGWQIVESYLKNNKVTLRQMINTDNEEIFNRSKYKPKKR
jgi:gliding motility-associated lipoprotein GldB